MAWRPYSSAGAASASARVPRRATDDALQQELERDARELDALIVAGSPLVAAEAQALGQRLRSHIDSTGPETIEERIVRALQNIDLPHGTLRTAGLLVASAAMGAGHARGISVATFPSADGLVAREFWQGQAGWTNAEYVMAVAAAKSRALLAHGSVVLGAAESLVEGNENVIDRSELITETETVVTYQGSKEWVQRKLAGPKSVGLYVTMGDELVCPVCGPMDLKAFPVGSAELAMVRPPRHFGCRCDVVIRDAGWVQDRLGKRALRKRVPKAPKARGFDREYKADWSKYPRHLVDALTGDGS